MVENITGFNLTRVEVGDGFRLGIRTAQSSKAIVLLVDRTELEDLAAQMRAVGVI